MAAKKKDKEEIKYRMTIGDGTGLGKEVFKIHKVNVEIAFRVCNVKK